MKILFSLTALVICTFAVQAQPKIKFLHQKHDFLTIKEDGGKVLHVFPFKNIGDADLIIKNVKTPCGCTSPQWTREAIAPGKGGYVEATFDPMHRPGAFSKTLTVISNTERVNAYLTISGEVLPRKKTITDYFPIAKGNLRYQSPQVVVGKVRMGTIDTVHVRVYNQGENPITITKVESEKHIKTDIIKGEIAPKTFGKFVLKYDPSKKLETGESTDKIEIHTTDPKYPKHTLFVFAQIEAYSRPLTVEELKNAPKIVFSEEEIDLGTIEEGTTMKGFFNIKNEGISSLKILKISPECGCTSTNIDKHILKEGESTKVGLKFNSTGYNGLIIKRIDIYSTDPNNPKYTLKIKATVTGKSK